MSDATSAVPPQYNILTIQTSTTSSGFHVVEKSIAYILKEILEMSKNLRARSKGDP